MTWGIKDSQDLSHEAILHIVDNDVRSALTSSKLMEARLTEVTENKVKVLRDHLPLGRPCTAHLVCGGFPWPQTTEFRKAKAGDSWCKWCANVHDVLKRWNGERRVGRKAINLTRGEVWDRTGGLCICCTLPVGERSDSGAVWHVGHVLSVAYGGTNELSNLVPLHPGCNTGMSTRWS
jgi:5-methylcytosine-specific restriction endonuclease McrA